MVEDGLDVVAVRVEDVRTVVAGVVVRALAGGATVFCLALVVAGFALAFLVRWQAAAPLLTLVALPVAELA